MQALSKTSVVHSTAPQPADPLIDVSSLVPRVRAGDAGQMWVSIRFATCMRWQVKKILKFGKSQLMFEKPPGWESETMVTGAFGVSIGWLRRFSGAFDGAGTGLGTESP